MRVFLILLAVCLSVAAAPVPQDASAASGTLTVHASGFAETVVEFSQDVVVSGEADSSWQGDTAVYDVEAMSFTTDAPFAAFVLVQETAHAFSGLQLIAKRFDVMGAPTESITI
ncbi:MAG: hypothetical protein ACI867_001183, partial [Glaciecola sp.]